MFWGYCLFLSGQDTTEIVVCIITFKTKQKTTKLFAGTDFETFKERTHHIRNQKMCSYLHTLNLRVECFVLIKHATEELETT